jgi:hypothetical protein
MVCYYWVGPLMHGLVQEWMISIELESDIDSMKKHEWRVIFLISIPSYV